MKQPKDFIGTEGNPRIESREEKIENRKLKSAKRIFTASLYFLALVGIISIGLTSYNFVTGHSWRSPFQTPWYTKEVKIISPVSKGKVSYVEEVKNPYNIHSPKGIAWEAVKKKWGLDQWIAFDNIITNESGWNPFIMNSIKACGLGQALPCEKMNCENWDYTCQVNWTSDYITRRYETPSKAWKHWLAKVPVNGKDVGNWY